MTIRIKINGQEYEPSTEERECTGIECWYDRHNRHWVLYPVDVERNQLDEARYAFGKKEAMAMMKDMEAALIGKKYDY